MGKSYQYSTRIFKYLLPVFILSFIISCESTLFIELEEADKLIVLNGAIAANSCIIVQVSRTRHILDNASISPLDKARVRITGDNMGTEELEYSGNGYYISENSRAVVGERYLLEVENSGYPTISASCIIPEPVKISSIDTATVLNNLQNIGFDNYGPIYDLIFQFDLTIQDPLDRENYYLLNVLADRSRFNYRDTTVIIVDSLFYAGQWNYFPRDSVYHIRSVRRFNDVPPIASEDIIVEATTSTGILFSDQLIDGKSYSFRGSIPIWSLESADSTILSFSLHSISESYYKYLKSRQLYYETKDDYLAVPVIVYSNVESGTGFFGGYSTDVNTITTIIPRNYHFPW